LRERAAANDLVGARKAWISARAGWERSEVFSAGFVPELDVQIDALPNAVSGFHAIEAKLFGAGRTDVEADAAALVALWTIFTASLPTCRDAARPAGWHPCGWPTRW